MSANRDNVEWLGKATFSNDISTIKLLLKNGVDVNWTDHMLGDTPLHLASRHGQYYSSNLTYSPRSRHKQGKHVQMYTTSLCIKWLQ